MNDSRGVAFAHHDDLQKPAAGVGADDEQPGLAVVLLFEVAERDMHCVSDIVAGDAVFFVVPRCAITDLNSVKIPLRSWLRQGWWCWRPVVAAAIRRRVVSCEFAQNPTAVRDGMDLTQTRAEPWVDPEMVAGADQRQARGVSS